MVEVRTIRVCTSQTYNVSTKKNWNLPYHSNTISQDALNTTCREIYDDLLGCVPEPTPYKNVFMCIVSDSNTVWYYVYMIHNALCMQYECVSIETIYDLRPRFVQYREMYDERMPLGKPESSCPITWCSWTDASF